MPNNPDNPDNDFKLVQDVNPIDHDWASEWFGMPEFNNALIKPHKEIIIRFRNEEDYQAFAKLIDQNLTEKTIGTWYPFLKRGLNSHKKYISE